MHIIVHDMQGRKLIEEKFTVSENESGKLSLNVQSLKSGSYLLDIHQAGYIVRFLFVRE